MKDDKDIILVSIKTSGGLLEFASENLKNDKEVVLAAVKKSGKSLEFAS